MRTAEELSITEEELAALLKVREGLASGCFVHVPDVEEVDLPDDEDSPLVKARKFNMNYTGIQASCGTVACIGGWMKTVMTPDAIPSEMRDYVYGYRHHVIGKLFFPKLEIDDYDRITPEQSVQAIDNFLATGDPRWSEVVE